jgi:hypothetical protein
VSSGFRHLDLETTVLETLDPMARDTLRRVLIHDQPDAIASQLLRYLDGRGDDWADIIDMLTMHPEARHQVVRMLAEIDAADRRYEDEPGGRTERDSPVVRAGALSPALGSRLRRRSLPTIDGEVRANSPPPAVASKAMCLEPIPLGDTLQTGDISLPHSDYV